MTNPSLAELEAALLLGERAVSYHAGARIGEQQIWAQAIRLAMLWRSVPRLRRRIAELGLELRSEDSSALSSFSAASAVESAMVCRGAARAFAALEKAGVDAACFKGLGMIASIYHTPSERMLNDADVLVRQSDLHAATAALRDAGFHPAIEMELDNWLELLEDRVYPVHDFLDFVDADGVRIDLHWKFRFGGEEFSVDEILGRSVDAVVAGKRIPVVSPEDLLLLSVNHLIRGRLAAFSAVKDLVDIEMLLANEKSGGIDVAILEQRARNAGLATSLLTATGILARYTPDGPTGGMHTQLSGRFGSQESAIAGRLADLFTHQLRRGSASEVVIGLAGATPGLARRFITSRIRVWTDPSYREHKFAGDNRPGVGESMRTFVRDIVTMTPTRFRQYRALATETRRQLAPKA